MANEEYINGVLKWRNEVDTNLRRENGWLALAACSGCAKARISLAQMQALI